MKSIVRIFRYISKKRKNLRSYLNRIRYLLSWWRFENAGRKGGIGKNVRFLGFPQMRFGDRVVIRDNVIIGGNGNLRIGSRTTINEGVILTSYQSIKIGSDCMIAPRVYILDVDHKYETRDYPVSEQGYNASPVNIEDDVWIGAYSVILRGVRIGRGAIVSAHSVCTRDVPDFAVVGGVPARLIKMRP